MNKLIGYLLLVSLLLSGCGSPSSTISPLPSKFTPILTTLKPCSVAGGTVKAECGELLVPEDRANPNSRILHLNMVVVRARNSNPEPDPFFLIAGGPGDAATSDGIVYGVNNWFRNINDQRDVVFLDQRGTNGKHRLICEYPDFQIVDTPQQKVNDWMKNCLANLDGDPRFYTTAVAMRDLDDARAALGYDKINLYGISYGVAAEQVYMRMFPEHVRAVVMDHGTALGLPFWDLVPRASQYALDQVFTYCEQDEKCHSAYPDIRGDWKKVLDRLAKGPVTTSFIAPGEDTPATLSLEGLARGIHQFMYNGDYGKIPFLIHLLATQQDWTSIAKSYYEQHGSSGGGNQFLLMALMIFCFEPAWGFPANEAARFSPGSYYLAMAQTGTQLDQKLCAALPRPDSSLVYGPGQPAPLSALMLNSLLDPQNPPFHMDLALQEFTQSRVVVEPTEGHNTSSSPCRWGIVAQYIDQGSVDGLDTSCLNDIKPSFMIGD